MLEFPRLKTFLSVFPIAENVWGLRGGSDEQWRLKLNDPRAIHALGALLPYLDGRTATEEILTALERAGVHRPAAAAVLRQLERSALIEEADEHGLSEVDLRQFEDQIRF